MSSIEINIWLQDAIEYRLKEHVRRIVKDRIPSDVTLDDHFAVRIHDIEHSYGFINVSWSYQKNARRYSTHENGTESFTLAEVLRICMKDEKEEG
jgi:hypothetical protein